MTYFRPSHRKIVLAIIFSVLCVIFLPFAKTQICVSSLGGMGVMPVEDCISLTTWTSVAVASINLLNNIGGYGVSELDVVFSVILNLFLTIIYIIVSYTFLCFIMHFTKKFKKHPRKKSR